ncbi:MAG: hypothetical protein GXP04_07745 [Alphaproteobacteria bacterium]|nr:hypothetical protein [Alphaproteobacteria bacterium]
MSGTGKTSDGSGGTLRFFFPSIGTSEEAISVSRQGSYAAAWGAFTAIFTVFMVQFYGEDVVIGESFRNQNLVLFLKAIEAIHAVLFLCFALLIWRRASLVSATVSFVLIFSEIVVRIVDLEISAFSWVWLWALLGAVNGIRGTKAVKKHVKLSLNSD